MTPPQPTPEHRAAAAARNEGYDPWASPPGGAGDRSGAHGGWGPPAPSSPVRGEADGKRGPARETAEALLTALVTAVLTGTALGLLWLWLAPRVRLVSDGENVLLRNAEGENAMGADATFLLLGLVIGAVTGAAVFLLRRSGGLGTVLGLAAGTGAGALLARRIGQELGPGENVVGRARELGAGVPFDGPLELGATGALVGLPLAAVGIHLLCVAVRGPQDEPPRPPEFPGWAGPQQPVGGV